MWLNRKQPSSYPPLLLIDTSSAFSSYTQNSFSIVISIYSKAYSSRPPEAAGSQFPPPFPLPRWFSSTCSCGHLVSLDNECVDKSPLQSHQLLTCVLLDDSAENDSLSLPGLCSHFLLHCQVKTIASDCVTLWQTFTIHWDSPASSREQSTCTASSAWCSAMT